MLQVKVLQVKVLRLRGTFSEPVASREALLNMENRAPDSSDKRETITSL